MTNEEQLEILKNELIKTKPKKVIGKIPSHEDGINHIIKYLSDNNGIAFTNELSKDMNASTARISSLINKLEERGFVKRQEADSDARKTKIVITELGKKYEKELQIKFDNLLTLLIDQIGLEELLNFIKTMGKINQVMSEIE